MTTDQIKEGVEVYYAKIKAAGVVVENAMIVNVTEKMFITKPGIDWSLRFRKDNHRLSFSAIQAVETLLESSQNKGIELCSALKINRATRDVLISWLLIERAKD